MTNKEKCAAYYQVNKEKIKSQRKLWYLKNKEKKNEYDKAYRAKNKDQIRNRTAQWRAENRERVREIQKRYYENNTETCKEAQRVKNRKNPQALKARIDLNHAVQSGEIDRLPCFICGEKAEAHHPCYELPLDVTWLCPVHHKEVHHA